MTNRSRLGSRKLSKTVRRTIWYSKKTL